MGNGGFLFGYVFRVENTAYWRVQLEERELCPWMVIGVSILFFSFVGILGIGEVVRWTT